MSLRRVFVWVLVVAVAANAVLVVDALSGGWLVPRAIAQGGTVQQTLKPSAPSASPAPDVGRDASAKLYAGLIAELTQQKDRLAEKARELVERERQIEVLKQEAVVERKKAAEDLAELERQKQDLAALKAPSFDKLLKAYGGMDPANAASALVQVYPRDRMTVIDLLLGLQPRQSAAVLDALAAEKASVAADLSYEVWKRDPRRKPQLP